MPLHSSERSPRDTGIPSTSFIHSAICEILDGYPTLFTSGILPFVEIGIAVLYFCKNQVAFVAACFSSILFGTFLMAQLSVLIRGIVIDCGCFGGIIKHEVGISSLLLLTIFLMVSIFAVKRNAHRKVLEVNQFVEEN